MTACRYSDREHLILTYHTDRAELVSDPSDEAVAPIRSPRALAHSGVGGRTGPGSGARAATAAQCRSATGNGGD